VHFDAESVHFSHWHISQFHSTAAIQYDVLRKEPGIWYKLTHTIAAIHLAYLVPNRFSAGIKERYQRVPLPLLQLPSRSAQCSTLVKPSLFVSVYAVYGA